MFISLLATAAAVACPAPHAFANTAPDELKGYRIVVAADGNSAVEAATLPAKHYPFPGSDKVMSVIDLAPSPAKAAKLVIGAADLVIPAKASPSKEMILVIEGSSRIETPHGTADLSPGMFVIFEDIGAKIGHGGRIGPCGYVGLAMSPP
ncbi:hypothetical protein [Sphingomonas immobilis]|uniref:Cupin domain-containing protein n=1 Tax=Sphingomonas immobilis TaxID=3063997 RepID=A0ABT9A0P8_9SPHN|nr:hypothetical protein [Sphingomonas sp. CA1-15]MDO7843399.1 hypothetical protein [Sphingomonas sp. CA1-15]